jgi:hypothetical protein
MMMPSQRRPLLAMVVRDVGLVSALESSVGEDSRNPAPERFAFLVLGGRRFVLQIEYFLEPI